MNYCERCHVAVPEERCPVCGQSHLPAVRGDDYCFLVEKEDMWAQMLLEILEDNGVHPICHDAMDVVWVMRGGEKSRQRIYVPFRHWDLAQELMQEAFPE